MSPQVNFRFSIHDRVMIKSIGMIGYVDGLLVASNGLEYRIVYWNDGVRKSEWMYPREITPCPKEGE